VRDFYHQSIEHEPSSIAHKDQLQQELTDAFKIEGFSVGPFGTSVSYTPVNEISFPNIDTLQFAVGYYYLEWAPKMRQTVKAQIALNGEKSHGFVSTKIHERV
jgi:hypothetical protein